MFKRCLAASSSLLSPHLTNSPAALLQRMTMASLGSDAFLKPLHYLNGKRVEPSNDKDTIPVIEPATGKLLTNMKSSNTKDVDEAVASAKNAFGQWSQLSPFERGKIVSKAAQLLRKYKEEVAQIDVLDCGKPIWEARVDVEGCADTLEYFGGVAATLTGEHVTLPNGCFGYTVREPLGVVAGIGAWNYPSQVATWKAAPALVCGNAVVFKPSPLTPLSAVVLAEIFTEAGLPGGIFNVVQGGVEVGQMLCGHSDVAKVSFTGSVQAGSSVMQMCAKDIKHVTLELGGKSPLIIFEDCDITNAVTGTMMANFLSQGQVCSNGTRVFVQEKIWDKFVEQLVERTKSMKIGNPMDDKTTVGATISKEQFEKVVGYIEGAKKQGARVLCGGERVVPESSLSGGYYLSPCILVDVTDDMNVAQLEVFGSVACLFKFSTEEEAVRRANNTKFGLAGGVFTKDLVRAHRVTSRLEAGSLCINNYNIAPCELPFGGFKKSGIGRENSLAALDHYTQLKSVFVEMGDILPSPF